MERKRESEREKYIWRERLSERGVERGREREKERERGREIYGESD